MPQRLDEMSDLERVTMKHTEAHELAANVEHSDMLRYIIRAALTEAKEDYFRRLPSGHPDRKE